MITATDLLHCNACTGGVRWFLAAYPDGATVDDLLAATRQHKIQWYYWVIDNVPLPASALTILAGDTDWEVRWAVARNASTPAAALDMLAGDANEDVRLAAKQTLLGVKK